MHRGSGPSSCPDCSTLCPSGRNLTDHIMAKNDAPEDHASLPEHPYDPFLRIVGVSLGRPGTAGEPCPWGLAFHVVFPYSPRQRRVVRAEIQSKDTGQIVVRLPDEVYPQGPCVSHIDLYDSRVMVDNEYSSVFDVHTLPHGIYTAKAELIDENDEVCQRDELDFEVANMPILAHRIELDWDAWKLPPEKARHLSGEAHVGDVDGDGVAEYIHTIGGRHLSVYRGDGEQLWRYDDPDGIRCNESGICAWDFNGDGRAEILTVRGSHPHLRLCILEGATGRTLHEIEYPVANGLEPIVTDEKGRRPGMRETGTTLLVVEGEPVLYGGNAWPADFRGLGVPKDILLQVGAANNVTHVAFTDELEVLWSNRWDDFTAGHEPAICDVDGDGRDEVAVGTSLLDHDGTLLWRHPMATFAGPWEDDHVDVSSAADINEDGRVEIAYCFRMVVDGLTGERLWHDPTWHGQDVHIGKFREDVPGLQLLFGDREYRATGHFIHGELADLRDAEGNKLWERRFMSMHGPQTINWLPNDLSQITVSPDLQRNAPNPNLQIFDGHGMLVDVLPSLSPFDEMRTRKTVPRGFQVLHPYLVVPHGEILVFQCGR